VARALDAELAVSRTSIVASSASTETNDGLSARTASTTRRAVVGSGKVPRSRTVSSIPEPSASLAPMGCLPEAEHQDPG
jgi:hypothetical protein